MSVLSVAFCLVGQTGICFCDPDPDDCGEHCHDCSDHTGDECRHLTIELDEFVATQADGVAPQTAAEPPARYRLEPLATAAARFRARPVSTAPPDSGGAYVSYSARIHPRS